jgi:hypothetical protein
MARPLEVEIDNEIARMPQFDVTCTIGTVLIGQQGDMTPIEAAFELIGAHDAEGRYAFEYNGYSYAVQVQKESY